MLKMVNWLKQLGAGRGFCLKDARIEDKLSRCREVWVLSVPCLWG